MEKRKNILFIMYDQLRYDYLSCAGHPYIHTPHMDRLAKMGMRFTNCYAQSTVCGASRMSTYTGRYVHSHGASWNNVPLRVGEMTLGDHLRATGMDCFLVGKTHMAVDKEAMDRLGLASDSIIGARVAEAGFDVWTRDDGLWSSGPDGVYDTRPSPYNAYLSAQGYSGENPWAEYANAGVDDAGNIASGWFMRNASLPSNIREQDSETPWLTREAMAFMTSRDSNSTPWLCHLSYIKPHWPYIVPAPYHTMYSINDIKPIIRHDIERENPHPIYKAFMNNRVSQSFAHDHVRETVIPAYMGLIKQCDDQLGHLLNWLETTNRLQDIIIVLTSDHGDYLGDHWLGEKELFHHQSVKVPLIVYDPSARADSTRGTTSDALIEAIDLTASFVQYAGNEYPDHILEGYPIWPIIKGEKSDLGREYVVSEYDYSHLPISKTLGVLPKDARLFMLADHNWKFIHAEGGFRPMLYDLINDPDELYDIGDDVKYEKVITMMYDRLSQWARRSSQRVTRSDLDIMTHRDTNKDIGILIGVYDKEEVTQRVAYPYTGRSKKIYL